MVAFVIPDGQVDALNYLLVSTPQADWMVKLYQNDFSPDIHATLSDLVEADFGGYSPATFPAFNGAAIGPDGYAIDEASSNQSFVASGLLPNNNIYGYYVVNTTAMPQHLVAVERFPDAPLPMGIAGDQIILHLVATLRDNSQ
jgi:hypothetical protein